MNPTARETVNVLYQAMNGGEFWRVYVAFSLLSIAAIIGFFPQAGFGIDRFRTIIKYHQLSLSAQTRLERVLLADYGDGRRSRRAGYGFAILAVVLAVLCAVPAVPPAVMLAIGMLAATAGAAVGLARRRAQGPRRAAALAPRELPRPLIIIGICDVVAMLCFTIDPALRAGSLLVAAAIGGMLFVAWQFSAAPVSFRGDNLALETAAENFVRADQNLTIASTMNSVTILCSCIVIAFAPHHMGAASITDGLIRLGAMVPVAVAVISLRALVKLRDFKPLAAALEAAPA